MRPRIPPRRCIGIIGGMGPDAGIDLVQKILRQTPARRDQDHWPVLLASFPSEIPDRTQFLLGRETRNPGDAIADMARTLHGAGAAVVGIPCNTAHAEPIMRVVMDSLARSAPALRIVNMVNETASRIREESGSGASVGILSTEGVKTSRVYQDALTRAGCRPIVSTEEEQNELVSRAIYDPVSGIKSSGVPVSQEAVSRLTHAAEALVGRGAKAVVLGCTEIPLAIRSSRLAGVPVFDPTEVLASALIREFREAASPGSVPGRDGD